MLNKNIETYKQKKDNSNEAFNNIYKQLIPYINCLYKQISIVGTDLNDYHSFALEQIFDCLNERKLKRGVGNKKVLSEFDDEQKNIKFLKSAIKYKLLREKRKTESNIEYTFNLEILNEDNNKYLDRDNQPLNIGINFIHKQAYLFDGKTNLGIKLNIPYVKNNRTVKNYNYSNPIDNCLSFDYINDDSDNCDDKETRDVLEFQCEKSKNDIFENARKNEILSVISKRHKNNKEIINITKQLLENSYSINALNEYKKNNIKSIKYIKPYLKIAFLKLGYL